MSNVKIKANASGSADFTIEAPATDSALTLTLPAETGSLLTNASDLPAANLTGTLPALDGSALTNLPGGGKVLQVIVGSRTATSGGTNTSYTDTGLSATITPTSASSKILVHFSGCIRALSNGQQDAHTDTAISRDNGSSYIVYGFNRTLDYDGNNHLVDWSSSMVTFDTPSTTSAITYKLYAQTNSGSSWELNPAGTESTITLMEIAS